MSRILVTGKNGQVGFGLLASLAALGQVMAVGRGEMDLSKPDSIRRAVREIGPDLIVNAAAYTAVDQAESEPELALAVNGVAPGILAEEAKRLGAALIHYSTDYVFDGTKLDGTRRDGTRMDGTRLDGTPLAGTRLDGTKLDGTKLNGIKAAAAPYTEDDEPRPINVYGRTKLAGERAIQAVDAPHLILRTSWIYGMRGNNFLLTMLRLARERDELSIVDDQIGAPTWSRALAEATRDILKRLGYGQPGFADACAKQRGIYNLSAAGQTSWCGFAAAIFAHAASARRGEATCALDRVPAVKPIATEQYPLPARRPRYSVLANAKVQRVFGVVMADWKTGLAECMRSDFR